MKKIALVLALLMLSTLAFSACTTSDTTTPAADVSAPAASTAPAGQTGPTEEELKNSKPNEYVPEKLEAGMEVLIGCSMVADVPILMEVWAGQITDVLLPMGFKWVINHSDRDAGIMISQIENYGTMGAAAIIIVPPDKDTIKDAVLKVQELGTDCVVFGIEGVDYCYSVRSDVVLSGTAQGKMAAAWANMTYPDASPENPVKGASLYDAAAVDAKRNGESFTKAFDDDPNCVIIYYSEDAKASPERGFQFAQDALTIDADIKVFLLLNGPEAIGVANYVMSQPGLDPSEFGVFNQNSSTDSLDAIQNLAPTNQSILRGSIEQEYLTGESLANCVINALFGVWENPYEFVNTPRSVVQPGWDYVAEI